MTAPTPNAGRVVVDPRFRARRIAVRRQAGRRRLKRLLVLVAVALVALTSVTVLRSPVLDVDLVRVTGTELTPAASIEEVAGINIGAPLLLVDLEGVEERVESLPWVADATVRRDLPSEVVVDIEERVPAAVVALGRTQLLVDDHGRVLERGDPAKYPPAVPRNPAFIPVVAPPNGAARAPGDLAPGALVDGKLLPAVSLAQRLRENPAGAVTSIRMRPSLRLSLAGGGHAELGDATELDAKVEAFRTVVARVDLTCARRLDLRVPTHPVLTRRASC